MKILSLGSPHGGKPPLAPLTDRNKPAVWAATPREAGWIICAKTSLSKNWFTQKLACAQSVGKKLVGVTPWSRERQKKGVKMVGAKTVCRSSLLPWACNRTLRKRGAGRSNERQDVGGTKPQRERGGRGGNRKRGKRMKDGEEGEGWWWRWRMKERGEGTQSNHFWRRRSQA